MKYINTKKEVFLGDRYFKEHLVPEGYNYKVYKKELVPFFEEYGFQVSRMYREFYQQYSHIESERYLSMDLYYFYIVPALNKNDFMDAWLDKNIYTELFPNVLQPQTVFKNMNGRYYADGTEIKKEEAVERIIYEKEPLIIKPTIRTCNGDGVSQIVDKDKNPSKINQVLSEYGRDFIVQRKVRQHNKMESLNPTSLNTLRLYTYRTLKGDIVYIDQPLIRFGGKDAVIDNASGGGGFCPIEKDGSVRDTIFQFKKLEVGSLKKEKGFVHFVIPSYQKAKELVLKLHERLPYFDYIGWDIAIDENGEPVFIEYNLIVGCEAPQCYCQIFGDYFDEVVQRACKVNKEEVHYIKNVFNDGASVFYLDIK